MLREIAVVFLRLGATAFGGPAAHVALMEREFVARRRWIDREQFVEMLGVTNLIPGPNSTELAAEIGRARAGLWGLVVAAGCFIAPAMVLMLGLAWLYVKYGTTVAARAVLDGVEPVVVALIAVAVVRLARTAARTLTTAVVAFFAFVGVLLGLDEVAVLGLAAVAVVVGRAGGGAIGSVVAIGPIGSLGAIASITAIAHQPLAWVFLLFLKFGATVFGSGYVLIAFLRGDLVERLGWLTEQQLIDAVSAGQVTPGPVFTTATFVGYLLGGFGGAVLATVGIFLPGLILIAAIAPLVERARRSKRWRDALAGLSAGAVGLLAGVAVPLAVVAAEDLLGIVLMVGALAVMLLRPAWNPVWLLIAGGVVGLIARG